jgi:putative hydrolase of the HAD superfamily
MQRFADIEAWVFDLDNTLYAPGKNLFAQIDVRMTAFIQDALKVDKDEAFRVQKEFLGEYGTTLSGLMAVHGLPPGPFLDFVHDIDVTVLDPDPHLANAIAALPGKKFIFTNGTLGHAERVSAQLGLWHLFDDVFDIVAADYAPKPNAATYPKMLARFGIDAGRSAFFEDMARNLTPAHQLGMATVLVAEKDANADEAMHMPEKYRQHDAAHIDVTTDNLAQFLVGISTAA